MKSLNIKISGKVQGVSFRSHAKKYAEIFQVNGYVKNMPDGSVEIAAEGEDKKLTDFVDAMKQGPQFAKIDNVQITEQKPQKFKNFEVF